MNINLYKWLFMVFDHNYFTGFAGKGWGGD